MPDSQSAAPTSFGREALSILSRPQFVTDIAKAKDVPCTARTPLVVPNPFSGRNLSKNRENDQNCRRSIDCNGYTPNRCRLCRTRRGDWLAAANDLQAAPNRETANRKTAFSLAGSGFRLAFDRNSPWRRVGHGGVAGTVGLGAEAQGGSPGWTYRWPHSVVRWLFGLGEEHRQPTSPSVPVARFQNICISREAGAGGSALARIVGERLGWKVYDEELIEAIAHRMEVPIDEVRALDEQAPSMVQDWLLPLREEYYAPQEAYLDHLAKLIEAIGRAGESILVGRGAGFMLPRETTLSLRVVAPLKARAQRLAERMGVRSARPVGPPAILIGAVPSSIAPCTAPTQRPAQFRHGARHG